MSWIYESANARYLLNELWRGEFGGRKVEVLGTEDAYSHEPDSDLFTEDTGVYRVLLSHEPLKQLVTEKADLMLFGHTHGGQINVLGVTCYLLMKYERRFRFYCLAGTKKVGNSTLLVSRGVGYSKLPIRLGAASEIHYIK